MKYALGIASPSPHSALACNGLAAVGLDLDAQRLGQQAVGVIVADRIGQLDDLLRREVLFQRRKGWVVDIAAVRHLLDISEDRTLFVVEQRRGLPLRQRSNLRVVI